VNEPPYKGAPKHPVLYVKPANTYAGDGDVIRLPADVAEVDVGACLAVEFSRAATRATADNALSHVAGYRVVADLSVPHDAFYRPPIKQKCRDGFCPISATLAPLAAVADPGRLQIEVRVDDRLVQQASTAELIRPVAQAIVDVTAFMTLQPGDLLLLGVPFGAPRARAGQRYRIDIEGVGRLENALAAPSA